MPKSSNIIVWAVKWKKNQDTYLHILGGSDSKESANARELVLSLSWADPLEKGMATHPLQYSCLENYMVGYSPWDGKESDTTEPLTLSLLYLHTFCAHGKITGSKYKRMVCENFCV